MSVHGSKMTGWAPHHTWLRRELKRSATANGECHRFTVLPPLELSACSCSLSSKSNLDFIALNAPYYAQFSRQCLDRCQLERW